MRCRHLERGAERIRRQASLGRPQDRTRGGGARDSGIGLQSGDAVVLTGPPELYPGPRLPEAGRCRRGFFQAIIPLPFIPDDSSLQHLPGPTGLENLRTIAVARLMLDNFPHVKAFWIMQTLELAQFMLLNGADDIDGTVVWYDITKVGTTSTHQETTAWDLQRAIREAGLRPVERDTLYRPIDRDGNTWRVSTPAECPAQLRHP